LRKASRCARVEERADAFELKGEVKIAGVHTEYARCLRRQNAPVVVIREAVRTKFSTGYKI
jgi:hypothetical protein